MTRTSKRAKTSASKENDWLMSAASARSMRWPGRPARSACWSSTRKQAPVIRSQLTNNDSLPAMVIQPLNPSPLKFASWVSLDVANDLLKRSKLDVAELKKRARDPKFRAFPIEGASLSVTGELKATPFVSHNVLGKITGATKPDEFILYGAHWDANGQTGAA